MRLITGALMLLEAYADSFSRDLSFQKRKSPGEKAVVFIQRNNICIKEGRSNGGTWRGDQTQRMIHFLATSGLQFGFCCCLSTLLGVNLGGAGYMIRDMVV